MPERTDGDVGATVVRVEDADGADAGVEARVVHDGKHDRLPVVHQRIEHAHSTDIICKLTMGHEYGWT